MFKADGPSRDTPTKAKKTMTTKYTSGVHSKATGRSMSNRVQVATHTSH